jgi:hypothetical protein
VKLDTVSCGCRQSLRDLFGTVNRVVVEDHVNLSSFRVVKMKFEFAFS